MSRNSALMACLMLVGFILVNQAAFARTCEEKSPNYVKLGDEYFDLEKAVINSDKNRQIISVFYDKLQGEWTGSRVLTECVDNDPENDNVLSAGFKNAATDVTFSVDSAGVVTLQTALYYDDNSTSSHWMLFSGVITDAVISGEQTLVYAEKFRQSHKQQQIVQSRHSSIFRETIGQVQVKGKALVIKLSNFSNGYFVSEELWTLLPGKLRR
jgi:hypothetical protein